MTQNGLNYPLRLWLLAVWIKVELLLQCRMLLANLLVGASHSHSIQLGVHLNIYQNFDITTEILEYK